MKNVSKIILLLLMLLSIIQVNSQQNVGTNLTGAAPVTNPAGLSQLEVRGKPFSQNENANPGPNFLTGNTSTNPYVPITNPLRWSTLGNFSTGDYGLKIRSGNLGINLGFVQANKYGLSWFSSTSAVPDFFFTPVSSTGSNNTPGTNANDQKLVISGTATGGSLSSVDYSVFANRSLIGSLSDGSFGNPFGNDGQWSALGKVDLSAISSSPQTLYGLRIQRAGRGLTMGYRGVFQNPGTTPTLGTAFIEWIGNNPTTPGVLDFNFATDPGTPGTPGARATIFKMEPSSATTGNSYSLNGYIGHLQDGIFNDAAANNNQWASIGRNNIAGLTYYGQNIQRNNRQIFMGYSGAGQLNNAPTLGNALIQWNGNNGTTAGDLDFKSASDNQNNQITQILKLTNTGNAILGTSTSSQFINPKMEINTNGNQLGLGIFTTNQSAINAISSNTKCAQFTSIGNLSQQTVEGVVGVASGSNGYNYGVYGYAEDNLVGSGSFKNNYGVGGKGQFGGLAIGVSGDAEAGTYGTWGLYGRAINPGNSWGLAGYFDGDAVATGSFYSFSDAGLKKNITKATSMLDKVLQLNTVSYNFDTEKHKDIQLTTKPQIGFISQEVEKIFPDLVKGINTPNRNENDLITSFTEYKALNYIGLVPVLTKAIQELNEKVTVLEKQLADAKSATYVATKTVTPQEQQLLANKTYMLAQNVPNPFSQSTVIRYSLPNNTDKAVLVIFNLNGTLIQQFALSAAKGSSQVTVNAGTLAAGKYIYSLIVNGEEVITKTMVVL